MSGRYISNMNHWLTRVTALLKIQVTNIIVCIIALLMFICIYGPYVINPLDTGWCVYQGSDAAQSYLGWKSYRISDWFFPLGMQNNLAYPMETSNMFTFCAPLLSFFFKLFSPILPQDFQFIGLFSLCSFMLQALITCWIIKLYSNNKILQILIPTLFLLVPSFLVRWLEQSFIGAHWILLSSIFILLNYRAYQNDYRVLAMWALLGILSAGIQMYWCLMCGFILIAYCIADFLTYKSIKHCIGSVVSFLLSALFITWLFGGISTTSSPKLQGDGLGVYSMNLNAFINPQGWSSILSDRPISEGQYEGLAYLGCGIIVLLVAAVIILICSGKAITIIKQNRALLISILICSILSLIFALSPIITLDDRVLFEIPVPNIVARMWDIFRGTGRFAWITVYFVMICSTVVIIKLSTKYTSGLLLSALLFLQVCDIYPRLNTIHNYYAHPIVYINPYAGNAALEEMIETNNPKHIVYVGNYTWQGMRLFDDWALSNNFTLNRFYFARNFGSIIEEYTSHALSNPSNQEVFVFNETSIPLCLEYDLNYYKVNEFVIGLTYELQNTVPLSEAELLDICKEIELSSKSN